MSKNYVKQALRGIRFQVVSISVSLDDYWMAEDEHTIPCIRSLKKIRESVDLCLEKIAELEKALEAEGL